MNDLVAALKVVHANTFVMYFKTHAFHWNIEGKNFPQYHDFFGDLYTDLFGAVDPLAEEIRALGEYAPMSLTELYSSCTLIENNSLLGDVLQEMLNSLLVDNNEVINSLNKVFTLANDANEQGLADLVAGRIDIHKKHSWMLRASLKG
jgi:starvation-inducible DNA-binding protein